jgi:hypothetical protein
MKQPTESLLNHIHYKALICAIDMRVLEGADEWNGVQIPSEPNQAFIAFLWIGIRCPAAGHFFKTCFSTQNEPVIIT